MNQNLFDLPKPYYIKEVKSKSTNQFCAGMGKRKHQMSSKPGLARPDLREPGKND